MSKNNPTINGSISGMFCDFILANHLDVPLSKSYLKSWKVDGRVSILELGLCLRLIQDKCPEPGLGIKIAEFFQPAYSGLLGYLILPCQNLNQAILQFKKYYALMWDGFSIDVIEKNEIVTITWDVPLFEPLEMHDDLLETLRVGYELGISCFIKMLQQITNEHNLLQPISISLPGSKPENSKIYSDFYKCPVSFKSKLGAVSFNICSLNIPIDLKNIYFIELLDRQADAYLKSININTKTINNDFVLKFQKALGRGIEEGKPTLDFVAREMAMSKSTLQNRLVEQDLNFQSMLDRIRLELAKMYMEDKLLSLTEISELLAFSEQSAFNRYFKRVTGLSPNQYKKTLVQI
ncbi:AraC family transcriptional regulator [Acinetobacter piscicola]|uniref:AraC family transcriptional regulator n=1 Tax=Acinetobacter piscicola TaxID=2006115 RepID=UPI000B7E66B4|nr:AraC family transcriptional regulator [Acinetobacter piscicola]